MFSLPQLPYDHAALEPVLSRTTLHTHHEKHQKTYVDNVNGLLAEAGRRPASLEEVIIQAAGDPSSRKLFNNAAQVWNHTFFWNSMSPNRQAPGESLSGAIDRAFGGLAGLKDAFVAEGAAHFGSGWVWLACESGALKVLSTHDAEDLVTHQGLAPLLVCDVWEHAYYLDHKNDRKGFLSAWFDALPNWSLADSQHAAVIGGGELWKHPLPTSAEAGTASASIR